MRDPKERLLDILAAISAIERYRDRDRANFERDELLQSWFLRHLQIIGEASMGLPEDVRVLAPEIPWSSIIGMRNILVHGYFDIDTGIVWEAATRDVPAIKPAVERLLKTNLYRPGRWQIVGFRNRIVHEYAGVDTEIVWTIVQNEVPRLLEQSEAILEE